MSGFVARENQIFDLLEAFHHRGLDFVVIGGYAVSAHDHRFSVDADLVVPDDRVAEFIDVLAANGFEAAVDRELDGSGVRYLAYENDADLPATIDLLVNALLCRQTDAAWRYGYFQQHATTAVIEGSERTVEVQIPQKELLVAVKLHSGRLTDARDAVALADDLDFDTVAEHLDRGDPEKLRRVLSNVEATVRSEDFADAFKGVFQAGTHPEANIERLRRFLQAQMTRRE